MTNTPQLAVLISSDLICFLMFRLISNILSGRLRIIVGRGYKRNLWNNRINNCINFRSRRWGSSLPGLRTLDPPLSPPLTWAEIFWCAFLQSHLQTSPPTPQKSYPKFRNPRTTFGNTPLCLPNYSIVRGVPEFVFPLESLSFCKLGAHAKICNVTACLQPRAAHALRSDQK